MSRASNLTNMLRLYGGQGHYVGSGISGFGDVTPDYAPPYGGVVFAPYDSHGPLGGLADDAIAGDYMRDINAPLGGLGDAPLVSSDGSVVLRTAKEKNRALFLDWLRVYSPTVFKIGVKHAEDWKDRNTVRTGNPAALSGLNDAASDAIMMGADATNASGGGSSTTDWFSQLATGITSLGTAYLGYEGQKNIIALNTQRAAAGLPPLDPSTGAPTVNTTVGLSPQLMARLQTGGSWLLIGAAVIAGLMVLKSITRK
jgi:hypothetical protein